MNIPEHRGGGGSLTQQALQCTSPRTTPGGTHPGWHHPGPVVGGPYLGDPYLGFASKGARFNQYSPVSFAGRTHVCLVQRANRSAWRPPAPKPAPQAGCAAPSNEPSYWLPAAMRWPEPPMVPPHFGHTPSCMAPPHSPIA